MTRILLTTAAAALFASTAMAQSESDASDADSNETEQTDDHATDTSDSDDRSTDPEDGDASDEEFASNDSADDEDAAETSNGQEATDDSEEEASSEPDSDGNAGSDDETDATSENTSAAEGNSADEASDEADTTDEAAADSDDASTPEIITEGLSIEGATATLPRIVAEEDGYVVIHTVLDGQPIAPASIGNAPVTAGNNENVEVTIDYDFVPGEDYVAMLHAETNNNDTYDFGEGSTDVDTPVAVDEEVVASPFVAP